MTSPFDPQRLAIVPYDPAHKALFIPPAAALNEPPYFCLRVNAAWRGYVSGMLDRLAYADVWIGNDEVIAVAVDRIEEIQALLGVPCEDDTAPAFWEDHTDSDGKYGDIPLTTRVGVWIMSAFMLYSGDPVAVLLYRHSVRQLLISYYQHGVGGVFQVLINGTLIDTVDTAGEDLIKDLIYDLDEILPFTATAQGALPEDPYTLEIRRADTDPGKAIGIMRRRLKAPPPTTVDAAEWILNFNADLGTMELFKDDVLQESIPVVDLVEPPWQDTPPPSYDEPLPVDIRCSAATGAMERFKTLVWEPLYTRFETTSSFIGFVMAAYSIVVVNPIVTLSFDVLKTLWNIWTADIDLDAADWQKVKCIFYDNLPESGLFDDDVLSAINGDLLAENSVKMNAIAVIIAAMVYNGINYIERVDPDNAADCVACLGEWEWTWNCATHQPALLARSPTQAAQYQYVSNGVSSILVSSTAHHLRFAYPSPTGAPFLLRWVEYEYTGPSGTTSNALIRLLYECEPLCDAITSVTTVQAGLRTTRWTLGTPLLVYTFGIYASYNRSSVGHTILHRVTVGGTGDNPFE